MSVVHVIMHWSWCVVHCKKVVHCMLQSNRAMSYDALQCTGTLRNVIKLHYSVRRQCTRHVHWSVGVIHLSQERDTAYKMCIGR